MAPDPITIEVVRAAFNAAAERMRITMLKTAYNIVITESLDFGCAIFDRAGRLLAQGAGVPLFQGHLGSVLHTILRARSGEEIRPGDVFIHNDPYTGNGNHLNDVAMFAPVFWKGTVHGWVGVKAHWMDVGGSVPGSILVDSTNIHQEGLRFYALKLYDEGRLNEEVMTLIRFNIRVESGTLKDLSAMTAVCRAGLSYFDEILAKYGAETVAAATNAFMEHSEKRTRAELLKLPTGTYRAAGYFDNDGIDLDQPVRIEVRIEIANGTMVVDCTGSSPQVKGPFNCGDAISLSVFRLLLACLTQGDEAADEGTYRPLQVIVPRGSVLAAQAPAPTARYYAPVILAFELAVRALAEGLPERIPAASFGDQMPAFLFGTNPVTQRLFIQGDAFAGGTGARPRHDGESGLANMTASNARNNPVEVIESRNPYIRVLKYGMRPDSGGRGQFRGGLGIERVYQFGIPAFGTFTLERKLTPPWGLRGGEAGATNQVVIRDAQGRTREVRKVTRHPIAAGDTMFVRTGGGGGIGKPADRDPRAVEEDRVQGYISEQAAREWFL
jgi:N-methylhydantoinase B